MELTMCLKHDCTNAHPSGESVFCSDSVSGERIREPEQSGCSDAIGLAEPQGSAAVFIQTRVKDCDKDDRKRNEERASEPDLLKKPYKVVRCSCRCRFCVDCAIGIGLSIREKLVPTVSKWQGMVMLSLTVNPGNFDSPESAYRYVTSRRLISRLVRELHRCGAIKSRKFFSVFEVQKNGNPHWHVLLEAKFVLHGIVTEIWNRWGAGEENTTENPAMGYAWISGSDFADPRHAAEYATKYLIKAPSAGWPDWVLDYQGQIHRCSRSHGLFKHLEEIKKVLYKHCLPCFCHSCREQIEADQPCECPPCEDAREQIANMPKREKTESEPRKMRTVRERLKHCGQSTVVLRRLVTEIRPGQQKCKFICFIDESFEEVCKRFGVGKAGQLFLSQDELDEVFSSDREKRRDTTNFEWIP